MLLSGFDHVWGGGDPITAHVPLRWALSHHDHFGGVGSAGAFGAFATLG